MKFHFLSSSRWILAYVQDSYIDFFRYLIQSLVAEWIVQAI